jgi:Ca2+:H+ antiporter
LSREAPLVLVVVTAALFFVFGEVWFATFDHLPFVALLSAWLFGSVMWAAFAVVRHADALAEALGEPLGTLVLTLSVTSIEVLMISAVMLKGADNPDLARDSMYSVVMIVLNGVVGLSLLLGGIRHREQHYNLQGANAFLAVIISLAVLGLVLPTYTRSAEGPRLSPGQEMFLAASALGLYAVFLGAQTIRHRSYFTSDDEPHPVAHHDDGTSPIVHALLLVAYLGPVVYLAEQLAIPLDHSIDELGLPTGLAGLLIALLVVSPEALSALRGALANQLQRSVNIALGSAAATIGITVPAILLVSLFTGEPLLLGLEGAPAVLLQLTLLVSVVTLGSGRTSVLQGAVHLVLFFAYVVLIFD